MTQSRPEENCYLLVPLGTETDPVFTAPTESFVGYVALANEAGLQAWLSEHGNNYYSNFGRVTAAIDEEFKKPAPHDEVAAWRAEAGLSYGDSLPDAAMSLRFDAAAQEMFTPQRDLNPDTLQFESRRPDTGIRLQWGIQAPHNPANTSILELPVRIDRGSSEHGVNFQNLEFHVGAEVGVGDYSSLSERASQELTIVVERFKQLVDGTPEEEMTPRLPYDQPKQIQDIKVDDATNPDTASQQGTRRRFSFWRTK